MFPPTRSFLFAAALALSSGTFVLAQNTSPWPLQPKPAGTLAIDLVTVSEPGVRHKCRVHSVTETAITCGIGPFRKPVIYPRENVAAIILPPTHAAMIDTVLELTAGAACLAASFFVPITAVVILLRVAAGLSPWIALTNVWDDDDHSNDIVAYQRPDTPLTVSLR